MMDVPAYAAGIRHKAGVYAANGNPALFVYPSDLHRPRWPQRLIARIRTAGEHARGAYARGPSYP